MCGIKFSFFRINRYAKIISRIIYFSVLNNKPIRIVTTDTLKVYSIFGGNLLPLIGVQNKDKIRKLTIIGFLNDSDVLFLRKMNNLEVLDLKDVIYPWNKFKKEKRAVDYYFTNPMSCREVLKEFIMPDNIKEIPSFAFKHYVCLQKIGLSRYLQKIGDYAFEGTAITHFLIPKTVISVGVDVFRDCKFLKTVEVEDGEGLLKWKGKQFSGCLLRSVYLGRDSRMGFSLVVNNTIEQLICGTRIKKINFQVEGLNKLICYSNRPPELDTKFHLETSVFVPKKYYANYWLSPEWDDIEVKML